MRVFVVIPIHNHIEETLRCLDALAKQTYGAITIIVVDGGSTDGSDRIIAERFPGATVVAGDDSMWWTGATALGVDLARESAQAGDFILFLNNDTVVGADYIEQLVRTSVGFGRAVTGSLNVNLHDPSMVIDSGVWWDWRTVSSHQVPMEAGSEGTTRVNTLSGRGLLVPIEVFERIGNVDVRGLPHYAADYEFTMRAARAGFPLAVSYKAVVQVNTTISGREGDLATRVGMREAWFLLFSRRSIRNVFDRIRLVRRACPAEYRIRNYFAVLAAAHWLLTNVTPMYQVKNALARWLLPRQLKDWMRARKLIP